MKNKGENIGLRHNAIGGIVSIKKLLPTDKHPHDYETQLKRFLNADFANIYLNFIHREMKERQSRFGEQIKERVEIFLKKFMCIKNSLYILWMLRKNRRISWKSKAVFEDIKIILTYYIVCMKMWKEMKAAKKREARNNFKGWGTCEKNN